MSFSERIIEKKQKRIPHVERVTLILVLAILITYLISIMALSSSFFGESSERNSLLYFEEDMTRIEQLVESHYTNISYVADKVRYAEDGMAVSEVLKTYRGSEQFGDLRFTNAGKIFDIYNAEVTGESEAAIHTLPSLERRGCSDIYYDSVAQTDCIAFFVPIKGSLVVDGIVSIVPARNIVTIGKEINEKSLAVAIINEDGFIYAEGLADNFSSALNNTAITLGNSYYDFISRITDSKETVIEVMSLVSAREKGAKLIKSFASNYTVAAAPIDSFDGKLILVTLSESEGLISVEMTYIRHIVTVLLIAIVSFTIALFFAWLFNKQKKDSLSYANLTDTSIDCPNSESFRRNVVDVIYSSTRNYAVVVFSTRQMTYLNETLGEEKVTRTMKFISTIIGNFCDDNETYGYAGDGKFLILFQAKNERYLKDKVRLIGTLANKYEELEQTETTLRFEVGVCFSQSKRRTVKELIDCATIAASENPNREPNMPYSVYNEEIGKVRARNEKIEAEMEEALLNGDFKVFLQPKYNVSLDKIDSAEALVRWFDPSRGDYKFPGEFITLFETNGFIVKLDHFIYLEVLKYLKSAVERGDKVVPVSVNVSRVTASAPDFIEFYVGNKYKYEVADGFITLEFTESFAMEDYDKISGLVDALHKSGIRCSIDDFGTGYSSFSLLKNIAMDELKLDRFFLADGIGRERDDKVIKSTIDLAASLGMQVVQEGVETKEMFDRVVGFGCNIIQGYYYAKAISLEEFKVFITTNTSIKYKSRVK